MVGKEEYVQEQRRARRWWANKEQDNYKIVLWHVRTVNKIGLALIGDTGRGKDVLSIGALGWVERLFLEELGAKSITKVDIAGSEEDDVIEADACNLPLENESFDMVVCREVIEHVDSGDDLLSEAYRVLRLGGYLFITTPNLFTWWIDMVSHVRLYSPYNFLKVLRSSGFTPIRKGGNIPYLFHTMFAAHLKINQSTYDRVQEEFIKLNKKFQKWGEAYYFSTQMMVLCRKER